MKKLPESLSAFGKIALEYLSEGRITDIEFSGATYQIQVMDKDTNQDVWTFIQLDEKGGIRDSFCSCEDNEKFSTCAHVAASFLRIYRNEKIPLHRRFTRSLWNHLCWLFSQHIGYSNSSVTVKKKCHYTIDTSRGKTLFWVKGKTPPACKRLEQILEERRKETEETSIKFSNLPQEEITLWHEGRPSAQLQYELSFWSDLAKWLMILQDKGEDYQIHIGYSHKQIPQSIHIIFKEIELEFFLPEAYLQYLIPSFATLEFPLKVHGLQGEGIERIYYDQTSKSLVIEAKESLKGSKAEKNPIPKKGHLIGDWLYVPKEGFYAMGEHALLMNPILKGEKISQALNEHLPVIESYLEGTQVHEDPLEVSYNIFFDDQWNLHISTFVFDFGDLTKPHSAYFGDWAYLEDKGFYRLEGIRFEDMESIIPRSRVSDFVSQNRSWLNTQEGFATYLISIESHLTYHLDEKNTLSFESRTEYKEGAETIDFDNWVYIQGQGFYQKSTPHLGLPLHPGVKVDEHGISLFIRMNKEELEGVSHFFSSRSPVSKIGLNISLNDDEVISTFPQYELLPEYRDSNLKFFDDYVYTPEEGFHELPIDPKLPERFRRQYEVSPENQEVFLEFELEQLKEFAFDIDKRLVRPNNISLEAQEIEKSEGEENAQYGVKLAYHSEKGQVDVTSLWKLLHDKKRFAFTDAGLLDLEEERYNWLRLLSGKKVDRKHRKLHLSTLDLLRLNAFDKITPPTHHKPGCENTRHLLKSITEFVIPEEPDFTGMKSELRPYQLIGLRWFWTLYHQHLSGLLCDDMGLGKTHQAMALIDAVKNFNKEKKLHFLVICPTSVIYHWQDKLHTFLPNIRVCTFYGSKRSLGDFTKDYDLLLTSYGIWRQDREILKEVPFEVAVFDEIQLAKNQNSLLHASLHDVKSRMRIGMTGTPIENHLRELKSLFDLTLPTYMPGETEYRDFFVKPIEKEHNAKRRELLSRFIKPFVLRRKKEEVLKDLPEKIEEISYCPLLPQQQELYHQVLENSRKSLIPQLEQDREPIPYLHVFALLSRLKRICDHPAVFLENPSQYRQYQSGKWNLFVELLSEARESQQKVVVFSQYLAQLDIFENYLKEHKIGFATIRGATVKRGEEVRRFQEDPHCEVFVASLQAAGLGIDLTAASVVIHYDRWWNAARENQATDRVHRIGQTRGVQVFKLVTRGTFEEKIDAMISRKGKLMEDVVASDDQQFLKSLDRNEILELLRDVEIGKEDQQEIIIDSD